MAWARLVGDLDFTLPATAELSLTPIILRTCPLPQLPLKLAKQQPSRMRRPSSAPRLPPFAPSSACGGMASPNRIGVHARTEQSKASRRASHRSCPGPDSGQRTPPLVHVDGRSVQGVPRPEGAHRRLHSTSPFVASHEVIAPEPEPRSSSAKPADGRWQQQCHPHSPA